MPSHPVSRGRGLVAVHVSLSAAPTIDQARGSLRDLDSLIEGVDGTGVARVSIGDHQGSHLECYTGLGYLAARSRRVNVGVAVTNLVNREAAVHAASLATLDAASRGRAFAVFGRGDGAVRNLGRLPQPIADFEASFRVLRDLLARGESRDHGRLVTMRWPADLTGRVRLGIAAGGPRMARLAGELADDVYLSYGVDARSIRSALDEVTRGAEPVGRTRPRAWWVVPFGIAETRSAALAQVGPTLATLANHSLRGMSYQRKGVPASMWEALAEFHRRFDWTKKNVAGSEAANVDLMSELGLFDYLLDRFAVAGTPKEIVERLEALATRGLDRLMIKVNTRSELDLLASEVLPRLGLAGSGGRTARDQ